MSRGLLPNQPGDQTPMMNPMMGGMNPMMGGQRPPGTGMMGTGLQSRQRTAMRNVGGVGVGLSQNVEVTDRPVTREGMLGMQQQRGSTAQKRQVLDKSFWMEEIRRKIAELASERIKLQSEARKLTADSSESENLVNKKKTLEQELEKFRGDSRDLNLAVEKLQEFGEDSIEQIEKQKNKIRLKNDQQRHENNQIFKQRADKEEEIRNIRERIHQLQEGLEQKLNSDINKKNTYYALKDERLTLDREQKLKQEELEQLQDVLDEQAEKLSHDSNKQRYYEKLQEKRGLELRKIGVENQLNSGEADGDKNKMLNDMKNEKQAMTNLTQERDSMLKLIEEQKTIVKKMAADLEAYKGDRFKKYNELRAKDDFLRNFMANFDKEKEDALNDMSARQQMIVQLLEHISVNITERENMPSQEKVAELKSELEFKNEQKNLSQTTLQRLEKDLELRKKELEKVSNLGDKIQQDFKTFDRKIRQMKEELVVYNDLDKLRSQYENQKKEAMSKRDELTRLRDTMKQQVHLVNRANEAQKKKLSSNEVHNAINDLEQKVRVYEQNNFTLKDYITQKGAETDYSGLKADSLKLLREINDACKQAVM
jgi:intraflagellar transport protein 74